MEYFEELFSKLSGIQNLSIAVIGDFTLDKFVFVDNTKLKFSVYNENAVFHVMNSKKSPGAAGAVCKNLVNLGVGQVYAIGFVGQDGNGYETISELERLGVQTTHLFSSELRKTPACTMIHENTDKEPDVFMESCEYDSINCTSTPVKVQQKLIDELDAILHTKKLDAVIVVDTCEHLNRGVICENVRRYLADAAKMCPDTIFLCDSSRFLLDFDGMLLKCNESELERTGIMTNKTIKEACKELASEKKKAVVVTSGENGCTLALPEEKPFRIPARPVPYNVLDSRSAGDEFTAAFVSSLCMGVSAPDAALIGTVGASLCCEQVASTGIVKMNDIQEALMLWLNTVSQTQKAAQPQYAGGARDA